MKFASPMIASTEEVGTPFVQFELLPQFVLVVPFQEVCAMAIPVSNTASNAKTVIDLIIFNT